MEFGTTFGKEVFFIVLLSENILPLPAGIIDKAAEETASLAQQVKLSFKIRLIGWRNTDNR